MASIPSLKHSLNPFFPELAEQNSTEALRRSGLFRQLRQEITSVLEGYEYGQFVTADMAAKPRYTAVAWNIERGIHYDGIRDFLKNDPAVAGADIFLLTETDLGMARSGNRNIARDLARDLGMNYYFVPSYLNLAKGSGLEATADGDNTLAIHGNAILSRYPMTDFQTVRLPNGKDKMRGKEKRIGSQQALIATLEFPDFPVRVVCVHLDAHSTQRHRRRQLRLVLEALAETALPVLIGGDWNTSTYDSSRAWRAIFGFWRRVFMGTHNMILNHYPYPERYFEKKIFGDLRSDGFDFEKCNVLGRGTMHYDVADLKKNTNLNDWIPDWCFKFIEWSLKEHNGRCSFKLDWFASRNLKVENPQVIDRPHSPDGTELSDHDLITVELEP